MHIIALILLLNLGPLFASQASTHYALDGRIRSLPPAVNYYATVAFDHLLWGNPKENSPQFGYTRWGLRGGGSPTYSAFLQVAPIAPIILEIQQGRTHRFLNAASVDCETLECKGFIDRTDYNGKFLGGISDFVFSLNFLYREIKTESSLKQIALENEVFNVSSGFHRYLETTIFAAYRLPNQDTLGLLTQWGSISEGDRHSSGRYLLYRKKWLDCNWSLGAGSYQSDQNNQSGFSAIFAINHQWGERLSLF